MLTILQRLLSCEPMTDVMFEGNQIVIQKSTTAPDPFVVFHKYIRSHDSLFPLFPQLWLHFDGSVPSLSWFLSRLYVFLSLLYWGPFHACWWCYWLLQVSLHLKFK